MIFQTTNKNWFTRIGSFLIWSLLFGIAYTQWPLYTGKQHTKFLQGIAAAGYGNLNQDWLVNTVDPLPLFSGLVYITVRFLHPSIFYLYHTLLIGVYLYAMVGIVAKISKLDAIATGKFLFAVLLIAVHSTLLFPFSVPLFGTSLGWLLQSGVAGQYLLNPEFEPGSFGVFLVLSIYLFFRGNPHWAALAAAFAALFHSAYLLSAGLLVFAYLLIVVWTQRSLRQASSIGGLALLVVAPQLLYNQTALGATSQEAWYQAQDIIVNFRIPHHSIPALWLDSAAYARIAVVIGALLMVWKTRLFPIILVSLLGGVGLTGLQIVTGSNTLAFIAPWRVSVFLTPLATGIILSKIISVFFYFPFLKTKYIQMVTGVLSALFLGMLVWRGANAMVDSFDARRADIRMPMLAHVQANKQSDDLYLVPPRMAEFRLETGAPVLITYKSHPYLDIEIIEWYRRLSTANDFYGSPNCTTLEKLQTDYLISHAVWENSQGELECDSWQTMYKDPIFSIYQHIEN